MKLTGEIDALKIEDVKLETLVTEEIHVQRKNAPKGDHMPLWRYVKKILEYLENASTKRIGICGEPQVGKSTVLKELNNCFHPGVSSYLSPSSLNSLKYDVVIWVNFPSKDSGNVKEKMQQEILISIREHDRQSLGHNAAKISEVLAKRKYLLILDDIYEAIDLADLGIHDDHEFGKIVIGASGQGVLKRMNVDETILIEKLEYDAAEKFFKECLSLESSDDNLSLVQPYIEKIIELLGGHIGALVGIADYMKGLGTNISDLGVWKAVVQDLQSPNSPENLELGALEKAYKLLYEGLQDMNLRKCLLYVALFPVGYHAHTSYLVECWKAEEFLHGYHTFKEARTRGHVVLLKLTERRLLEWSDKEHLKMPILFRKIALQIPYPDDEGEGKLLVRNISNRCNHPSEQDWNIAKRISLMCGKLNSEFLPDCPMCNNTLTLLLQANLTLDVINDLFFVNMGNLRVLDLQRTGIISLPNSISALRLLKCLYLNDCSRLESLPTEIQELKQLELLDIRRTLMRCLPDEIWYLTTLRCLRISVYSLAGGTDFSKEIVVMLSRQEPLPCFSLEFLKLKFLEELTVHVDPQTPDRRLIVDQFKKVLKKEQKHYLIVRWEPEESYLHNSNNVVANSTLPHSSSPITENGITEMQPTTFNELNHVKQLDNTEASTSTPNSVPRESTKEWVAETFGSKNLKKLD
ncbi:probable disease resistance protein At4g27220 [Lycium barbarum]|uniref:probable disease resistance protein At4g27220 n=1 Tax=Lycium barbarum TaxID=112863 RepID=UPI00293E816A|nr:probable disease resistance protein At4g27220 [Lycium barbarum]